MSRRLIALPLVFAALLALVGSSALAQPPAAGSRLVVTITNISPQIISPPILVTHNWRFRVFSAGVPASPELAAVAEDAVADGLLAVLEADPNVLDHAIASGPLMPGRRVTLEVDVAPFMDRLSAIGMLVSTNDAFFGLTNHRIDLPVNRVDHVFAPAWDAGTEFNSESCELIPGPPCGNPGVRDTDGAEGRVGIHTGIHGIGDLQPSMWTWNNPVVEITIAHRP